MTVAFSPTQPRVGQPVTFRVIADDPDSPIYTGACGPYHYFGDEAAQGQCSPACAAPREDAPTTTVQPEHGHQEDTYTHVYERPGTFNAVFHYQSYGPCQSTPYGSEATETIAVPVQN